MKSLRFKNTYFLSVLFLLFFLVACKEEKKQNLAKNNQKINTDNLSFNVLSDDIIISKPVDYINLIKQKNIGLVANQTSVVKNKKNGFTHLADTLLTLKIHLKKIFTPEHGFRGKADAGEKIKDGIDAHTGLPVISLYGKNRKPSKKSLADLDIVIFDIQDVGARFYTYISTLHYVMEACAEAGVSVIVIDRPNPNAHYIDGPICEKEYKSFVGMHPVPVVYGMTIGEYAQMINGEKWLKNGVQCNLTVMPLKNYTHNTPYSLPVKPSPNLPSDQSVNLYPSLCFFEGTKISAGRGTEIQFQVFGAPFLPKEQFPFTFTPKSNEGAKNPKFKGKLCYGKDLRTTKKLNNINLEWLISTYNATLDKTNFFNNFINKLAGNSALKSQIQAGKSAKDIRKTWQPGIEEFKKIRSKYLIYK